jgi:hypothetical protein
MDERPLALIAELALHKGVNRQLSLPSGIWTAASDPRKEPRERPPRRA